jgi:hypothetical protein
MVLSILASMTASIALDPLIAEAKQRMRRRRTMVAMVLLACATVMTLALRPWGSAPIEHVSLTAESRGALSRLQVPVDSGERQWQSAVKRLEGAAAPQSAVDARLREVKRALDATGATLVRITIWPRTSPPAVELVVATRTASAIFVGRRFTQFLALGRPDYLKVVDAHGSEAFLWGGAGNEGFVGSAPALAGCIEGMHGGASVHPPPPCPV